MVIARSHGGAAGTAKMTGTTANRRATDSPRMPQAVPKRIHTRSPGRPGKPIHYRRTTPSPLLCGAHNKGEHIVRGEVGSIVQSSLQGMAMGLRSACCISRLFAGVRTAFGFRNIAISALIERMSMSWHLRHAQGRAAHSAGNTRPPPSTPCLPGLRRESHNDRHSTAAGCRSCEWNRTGCEHGNCYLR